jgi:hypothetical protein
MRSKGKVDSLDERAKPSDSEIRQLNRLEEQLVKSINRLKALNSPKFQPSLRNRVQELLQEADKAMWRGLSIDSSVAEPSALAVDQLYDRTEQVRSLLFRLSVDFQDQYTQLDPGTQLYAESDASRLKSELSIAVPIIMRLQAKIVIIRDRHSLLPAELPAPIHVELRDNTLVRVSPKMISGQLPKSAILKMRASAAEMLKNVVKLIELSDNVDKRLTFVLAPLESQLTNEYENDFSIESLGDNWRLLRHLKFKMESELSPVLLALLDRCLESIETILLQFSEWHAYIEAEKNFHVSEEQAQIIINVARDAASDLEKDPVIIDKTIVEGLREIVEPAVSGLVRAEAIMPPLISSLSNIFAAISQVVVEAAPIISVEAAKLGVGGKYALVMLAISIMHKYGVTLANIPMLAFVREAYEYVGKNFPYLKDFVR